MRNIYFTQYLLPAGQKQTGWFSRPDYVADKAEEIVSQGYRLEAEVLTTGQVSLTVFNPETEEDEDIEVCSNGPEVLEAVDRLIERFYDAVS